MRVAIVGNKHRLIYYMNDESPQDIASTIGLLKAKIETVKSS